MTCDGKAQAWIGHKSAAASGSSAFKVNRYYHTDWIPENELALRIDGLTLDAVYDNFVKQVAELQGRSGTQIAVPPKTLRKAWRAKSSKSRSPRWKRK